MKKLFYLVAALLLLATTSCNRYGENGPNLFDPEEYCWEITMTATKDGETGTEIEHQWATGAEIIAFFEMVQYKLKDEAPGATLEVKFNKTDRSEEDCRK